MNKLTKRTGSALVAYGDSRGRHPQISKSGLSGLGSIDTFCKHMHSFQV